MAHGNPLNNCSFQHQGDGRKHHFTAFKETNLSNSASRRKGICRLAQVISADKFQNMVKSMPPDNLAACNDHSGVRLVLIKLDAQAPLHAAVFLHYKR
nr:hypothetical protein [Kosakonia sp. S42]